MVPEDVARFREAHRRAHIGPRYSGLLHFAFTSGCGLAVMALAISRLHDVRPLEWLTIPVAFLFGNFVEYRGHKGPMHHRGRIAFPYKRHTLEHHRFYTNDAMAAESRRDYQMVLFPPSLLLYFLGGFLAPSVLILRWLLGSNVAWLFLMTGMAYFLTYEWLHLAYHLPEGHRVRRLPLLDRLRELHLQHHDPRLMQHWNFNITFPICDALFGTRYRND